MTIGIAVVSIAVMVGCAAATPPPAAEETKPSPSPSATAVERYENSDFERLQPLAPDLQYIQDMTASEYRAQLSQIPLVDRVAWASWADQYIHEYADYFYAVTANDQDVPLPLVDGDFLSMLSRFQYQLRVAESFGSGTPSAMHTNGPLDRPTIEKYLASLIVGSNAPSQIDQLIASLGTQGEAINVVQEAYLNRLNFVQNAMDDPGAVSSRDTAVVDGFALNGLRYSYTDSDGGTVHNGLLVIVGERVVLVV